MDIVGFRPAKGANNEGECGIDVQLRPATWSGGVMVLSMTVVLGAICPWGSMAQDWEALPDMPFDGKWETGAVVLDGKLYFFGGFTGGNTWSSDLATHRLKKRVDVFNTKDRGWTQVLDMPSAISHFNTVLDGRTVWIAGGARRPEASRR